VSLVELKSHCNKQTLLRQLSDRKTKTDPSIYRPVQTRPLLDNNIPEGHAQRKLPIVLMQLCEHGLNCSHSSISAPVYTATVAYCALIVIIVEQYIR